MTPERKKWWDSLPKAEKMIRNEIERAAMEIPEVKKYIKTKKLYNYDERYFNILLANKKIYIRTLRKQIAMNPTYKKVDGQDEPYCPVCHNRITSWLNFIYGKKPNYCKNCGQKLRW